MPHRAGILARLVNIRGEITLCAHLWKILGLPAPGAAQSGRMLVVRRESERWVFAVDSIEQVHRLPLADVGLPPATVGRAANHLARGVFAWEGHSVGLLDDERLFETLRGKLR